jgi:hypothetical protein
LSVDLHEISAALVDALRGPLGEWDLSHVDSVKRGRYSHPPVPGAQAFAALSAPQVASDLEGQVLGQYGRTLVYDLQLWAACSSSDLDARVETSERLIDEAHQVLERARLTPGNPLYSLIGFAIRTTALDGLSDPLPPGWAMALLVIECSYRRRTGLGGTEAP